MCYLFFLSVEDDKHILTDTVGRWESAAREASQLLRDGCGFITKSVRENFLCLENRAEFKELIEQGKVIEAYITAKKYCIKKNEVQRSF
ncbi:MAG: hypothetical protein ACLTTO_02720 [Lachnospiraceae bacterium]